MVIDFHGGLITLYGCGCFNSYYFNVTNCRQFSTTINRLPTINGSRRPMSRLLGTLIFSLMVQIGMLPIPIFLVRPIRLLIVWIRLSHSIKCWKLPLLIHELLLKHINFRLPLYMSIVASSPWIVLPSRLGIFIPSISVAVLVKYLFLVILTHRVPLIWVILSIFVGECGTRVTTETDFYWRRNAYWLPVVSARLFQKVFVQRNAPVKILTQAFIRHNAGHNRVEARVFDDLAE